MNTTTIGNNDMELKPGDACYVGCVPGNRQVRFYAYSINGLCYFGNNKTEAITMGRTRDQARPSRHGQHWKCYKKM